MRRQSQLAYFTPVQPVLTRQPPLCSIWMAAGILAASTLAAVPAVRAQEASAVLRGFVTDAANQLPLPGANLVLQPLGEPAQTPRGAVAGRDGLYQLPRVPAGRYVLRATFIGYAPSADTLVLGGEGVVTRNVALVPVPAELGEAVVEAAGGAAELEAGRQTVRPADMARIPTPDPSGDLASYLQALPSVVAIGDRGGQLYVRGGTPSQNLVLMDGLLVYQPFHIVGFFSAFPEELVASADLYAGGYPARYSGRISSVVDVAMREGDLERPRATASVSPFLASVTAEGPLQRGALSLLGSVRTSLVEPIAPVLLGRDLPVRFGDAFLKLTHAQRDNGRCTATALYTYDRGRIDPDTVARGDVFRWRNAAVGGRCLALRPGSPLVFEVSGGLSYVGNDVGAGAEPERQSRALLVNTDLHFSTTWGRTPVGFGFFTRADFLGYRLAESFAALRDDDALLISSGVYAEATLGLPGHVELTPGLALSAYFSDYAPSVEPRLRATWRPWGPGSPTEVSAALGLYRQTINGISDERDAGSAFLAWLPNPVGAGQAKAAHAIVGVQQRAGPLRLSAEGYAKRIRDLAVPVWSTLARFTTTLTAADGLARGLDARVEWRTRPARPGGAGLYSYVGYGLAEVEYAASQGNFGVWFGEPTQRYHPPHDRRHQLSALASVDVAGVAASVRWQYGSGLPYTRPFGFDEFFAFYPLPDVTENPGVPRVLFGRPYGGRLPAYHRLDVALERAFQLRAGTLTVQGGAINAYDRANLFYYDVFTARRLDQLPLLPYVGLKFETR